MIQFRQVEAFRCLMVTGTTVGAARQMNITQPAISRLISDLEADLGIRLFTRTKGRLEPTNAGIRFYKAVEENFLGLERLRQVANNIRNDAPEHINVACSPVLSTSLLPQVLKEFVSDDPKVTIHVTSCNTSEILLKLQDMKVDMALCPAFPEIAGIEQTHLMDLGMLCAMPPGHRLAEKALIYPDDLEGETLIGWLPIGPRAYDMEQATIDKAQIKTRYSIKTHSSHTRYAMVAHGLGISVVEPFAARIWQPNQVVVRPFVSEIRYRYVLAYPTSAKRSELVADFQAATLRAIRAYDFNVEGYENWRCLT
ncbi:LysR substrate-binding domain-containing protein [Pokkaliibacter sp. CJK22405]|uniref:LysR substrate-binding domain-containing protein n=1 Tax=Pokkaliibacter sp. CJK22405 TaxID=3384615 RepID=UPI003984791F